MNKLIQKILFKLDPETAHWMALTSLQWVYRLKLTRFFFKQATEAPLTVMGLTFKNRLGIAAGLDKNADYVDGLAQLPVGFIEIGTVTPKAQPGNPKPRLFRLIPEKAIINRMGFNNKGVAYVAKKLSRLKYRGILGVNLGINKTTSLENAADDYLVGMRALWPYASYFTINISSPNTQQLRQLQQEDYLAGLLKKLKQEQQTIFNAHKKYVPLVVKLAPDLSTEALEKIAALLLTEKIDAVIATNTTIARDTIPNSPYQNEAGGLSGAPLTALSTDVIRQLHGLLKNEIPIIASGGVMDATSYQEKIQAGAALVQVYTGLIYSTVTDFAKLRG